MCFWKGKVIYTIWWKCLWVHILVLRLAAPLMPVILKHVNLKDIELHHRDFHYRFCYRDWESCGKNEPRDFWFLYALFVYVGRTHHFLWWKHGSSPWQGTKHFGLRSVIGNTSVLQTEESGIVLRLVLEKMPLYPIVGMDGTENPRNLVRLQVVARKLIHRQND